MARKPLKTLAVAAGAAFAGSVVVSGSAAATGNPFGMTELNSGYMQLASGHEGKCGAGKCGNPAKADLKKKEGKCGAGKCGNPAKADLKKKEGKCGAGKCGGSR